MIDIENLEYLSREFELIPSAKLFNFAVALLEDKEREITRLTFISTTLKDNIDELQAHINNLREWLGYLGNECKKYGVTVTVKGESFTEALSKTPARSLQEHDNEVIERCAQLSDACAYMSENFNALSEEIRALKVSND